MSVQNFSTTHIARVSFVLLFFIGACKPDPIEPDLPQTVLIPETYSFDNVSFSGQTDRINQLDEMIEYMESANQEGITLQLGVLNDMFSNKDGNGNGFFTFSSTKQLRDKCFEPDLAIFQGYFEKIVLTSQSTKPASNGQAGRMYSSSEPGKSKLFDENGWEYSEVFEKAVMGAVFYYQATSHYLTPEKMDVDNTTVTPDEGTPMQHHWDEAYGYLAVSTNFPNELENLKFWGKYCNGREAVLNTNTDLSYAFRMGRQAINVQRYDKRDEALINVKKAWETVCVGTALHYLNSAIANIGDDFARNHALSEGTGFISNLFYNDTRVISEVQINEIQSLIGNNLYEVTADNLISARDKLAAIYKLEDKKSIL